ncbi:hypothetical protein GGS24DRAFT_452441 [Hypoxylon argillaceum]|nr:hypothetical protein GGS24DRAFT_452441 [Hypoxylon argillaceum]KAI1151939.1 hypothetical protein F4825DRAFT_421248 [Nemania diffusa]
MVWDSISLSIAIIPPTAASTERPIYLYKILDKIVILDILQAESTSGSTHQAYPYFQSPPLTSTKSLYSSSRISDSKAELGRQLCQHEGQWNCLLMYLIWYLATS